MACAICGEEEKICECPVPEGEEEEGEEGGRDTCLACGMPLYGGKCRYDCGAKGW